MSLLRNISWKDYESDVLLYKVDIGNDYISKGSALTVREGQVAVFCDKGRMADVFLPGYYKLSTDNIPLLTKLMSWKYGFESPFKSDVYFVNTVQFTNQKWGTANPIMIRDADYGAIRVRGYGSYAFQVDDAYVFLTQLVGANTGFRTRDITDYLKSIVITGICDSIGESKIPVLDMAGNLIELGQMVEVSLATTFKNMGLKLTKFNFENFSLPEALEKAMDENTSLGMLGKNMNTYMAKAQADALQSAAKNTGMAGTGMGVGLGLGVGNMFGNMFNGASRSGVASDNSKSNTKCSKCGANIAEDAKFCPECGAACGIVCPKCKAIIKENAKFCPECGTPMVAKCSKCGATLSAGAKFCPECGERL